VKKYQWVLRPFSVDQPRVLPTTLTPPQTPMIPSPRVHQGRRKLWLRNDIDRAIVPPDIADRDLAEGLRCSASPFHVFVIARRLAKQIDQILFPLVRCLSEPLNHFDAAQLSWQSVPL